MKELFVKNNVYTEDDSTYLQKNFGLDADLARLFSSRGVTRGNASRYFHFNESNFYDPFFMKDMDKAAEIVASAMRANERILVYGDYDADGLTASAILKLFFLHNGVDCDVIVPTRDEGYGMHVENVFEAFESHKYGLIVTVDCGISNKDEIAVLQKALGVPILVTDHHEPPSELPDCVCVNPKLGYPFPFLSGSGVAWKLVHAVGGYEQSKHYADLAMVGTVADMMPLIDENRDIVILGLKNLRNKGLVKLAELSNCSKPYTASDIALRIAPKINAAGRLGDPTLALNVLLMQDAASDAAVKDLISVNEERKCLVEETAKSAAAELDTKRALGEGLIFLCGESWKSGVLGIVANRFKEAYGVPAVLLTRDGENYVGSARGTDNVNLFRLFEACSDILVKYGGHKSSVGFTVARENLPALYERLVQETAKAEKTDTICLYDLDFDAKYLVKENFALLNVSEPLLPNDKITFYAADYAKTASLFGSDKNHLRLTLNSGLELKGFYRYADYFEPIALGAMCEFLFSLEYDTYSKRVIGVISNMRLKNSLRFDDLYVKNLVARIAPGESEYLSVQQTKKILSARSVLAVFASHYEFEKASETFDFSDYTLFYFAQNAYTANAVLISPVSDEMFSRYANIIVFGDYNGFSPVYSADFRQFKLSGGLPPYMNLRVDHAVCAAVYRALAQNNKAVDLKNLYLKLRLGDINFTQFFTAVKIFQELGLLKIEEPFDYKILQVEKTELSLSGLYGLFNSVD